MLRGKRKAQTQDADKDFLEFTPLGSGQEVGRSCHLLKFKGKTIMVRTFSISLLLVYFLSSLLSTSTPLLIPIRHTLTNRARIYYFLKLLYRFRLFVWLFLGLGSFLTVILIISIIVVGLWCPSGIYREELLTLL